MTVKELKDVLDGCSDEAIVLIVDDENREISLVLDEDIYQSKDCRTVSIHFPTVVSNG